MSREYDNQIVAKFEKDLEELLKERAEIDRKIANVRQVLEAVSALSGIQLDPALSALQERDVLGLTGSIRQILQKACSEGRTAAEIRKELRFYGVNLTKYANASAVINTVLNRLHSKGVVAKDTSKGTARYRDISTEKMRTELSKLRKEKK